MAGRLVERRDEQITARSANCSAQCREPHDSWRDSVFFLFPELFLFHSNPFCQRCQSLVRLPIMRGEDEKIRQFLF
jgi:hypothetical protein